MIQIYLQLREHMYHRHGLDQNVKTSISRMCSCPIVCTCHLMKIPYRCHMVYIYMYRFLQNTRFHGDTDVWCLRIADHIYIIYIRTVYSPYIIGKHIFYPVIAVTGRLRHVTLLGQACTDVQYWPHPLTTYVSGRSELVRYKAGVGLNTHTT